jgi:hypothetical protein
MKSRRPAGWLKKNGYEIHKMWTPSYVGVNGNERANQLARDTVENAIE